MKHIQKFFHTQFNAWWQVIRFGLIWSAFGLGMMLAFFTLLTALDWLLILLEIEQLGSGVIIISTMIILSTIQLLYRWVRNLIDSIFFPDSADFRENIVRACQRLTEVDKQTDLEHFVTHILPSQLQIDYIDIHKSSEVATLAFSPQRNGSTQSTATPTQESTNLRLTLEMGERSLGILSVGPKCSGRSFSAEELLALKQLQEQISLVLSVTQLQKARAKAERTDQLKSNFLTNISHELRTPLNAVINSTGLVADGILGPTTDEQQEYLNRAATGSEYLMSLLSDILDITRIETDQLTLQWNIVELEGVVEDVLPMIKGMLHDKPVDLMIAIAEDLPTLMADRLRIRQIMLNLLSNAAKFTKTGYIRISAWQADDKVLVSVEDTGVGIAEEDLPLIFQDYQQIVSQNGGVNPTERRRHFGTGLGMPITQALVELHGGHIGVQSELGHGSTFTFSIPLLLPTPDQAIGGDRPLSKQLGSTL